jgi:acyl-CoA thioester hydrolase
MEREEQVALAVAEARCRYKFPARFDDEIIVKTWIEEATTRTVLFRYEMRRAQDDRVLAQGETKHVFVGPDMRPTRAPQKYHSLFGIGK